MRFQQRHMPGSSPAHVVVSLISRVMNLVRICVLTVVDNFSRECMMNSSDQRINEDNVVKHMQWLQVVRDRCPDRIQVDNDSEFISKVLDK